MNEAVFDRDVGQSQGGDDVNVMVAGQDGQHLQTDGMKSNQIKAPAKRKKKIYTTDNNLGCFMLWWPRMEREGLKEKFENDMEKKRNQGAIAIKAFLVKNSQNTNTRNENKRKEIELENDEVISEQSLNIPFQKQANLNSYTVGVRGGASKDHQAATFKVQEDKFDDLVSFFVAGQGWCTIQLICLQHA